MPGRRTNEQLMAWMREKGAELGPLADIDWARFDPTKADQAEVDAMEAPAMKFFATVTKREYLIEAHKREMLGYPVSTVGDIVTDPQIEARGFFQSIEGEQGTERYCGSFAVIDGERPPLRYAAGTPFDEAAHRIAEAGRGTDHERRSAGARRPSRSWSSAAMPPVRISASSSANFGAKVVHVELRDRPDGFRLQYPPFAGNKPGA